MKNNLIITLLILLALPIKTIAWGEQGHSIVASIAKKTVSKNILDSVQFYLGKTTFKQAALWMDEIKSDKSYKHLNNWHYINLEKNQLYEKNSEVNIVNKLEEAIAVIKNRKKHSKSEIEFSLKVIFHLVGDIHQPLHAGYASDKGGNTIKVDFFGRNSNLHRVWDTDLIQYKRIGVKNCYELANSLSTKEKKEFQEINVVSWMEESRALLPLVYDIKDNTITLPYANQNTDVIKKQLVKAGIRLAYILHEAFS
ncbi:MAG: S1/P1 nuclease [Bacteroidia bacterium]|nr:S1/P1 nuclease [Bacteroidia bacterium]